MYVIPSGKDEAHYTLMFEGDNNVEDMWKRLMVLFG